MPRSLPLLLALTFAASAAAQTPVVLTKTDTGVRMSSATDQPHGAEPAALIVHHATGGWALRPLTVGEVPTQVVSEMATTPQRLRERRLASDVIEERVSGPVLPTFARYTVRAEVPAADLDAVLVRLAEEPALRGLEATAQDDRGAVEATFEFGSVAEWAVWKATPEAAAVLALLADGRTTLHAR